MLLVTSTLAFAGKAGSLPAWSLVSDSAWVSSSHATLGWQGLTMKNTLAYFNTELITANKNYIEEPGNTIGVTVPLTSCLTSLESVV